MVPLFADFLQASSSHRRASEAALSGPDEAGYRAALDADRELRRLGEEVRLLAPSGVVAAADRLLADHENLRHYGNPASGADDRVELIIQYSNSTLDGEAGFVSTARASLGIDD